jgi:hypothetical protein
LRDHHEGESLPIRTLPIADFLLARQSDNAQHYSRSHGAVIHVYDSAGDPIEKHQHKGDFKEPWASVEWLINQSW